MMLLPRTWHPERPLKTQSLHVRSFCSGRPVSRTWRGVAPGTGDGPRAEGSVSSNPAPRSRACSAWMSAKALAAPPSSRVLGEEWSKPKRFEKRRAQGFQEVPWELGHSHKGEPPRSSVWSLWPHRWQDSRPLIRWAPRIPKTSPSTRVLSSSNPRV